MAQEGPIVPRRLKSIPSRTTPADAGIRAEPIDPPKINFDANFCETFKNDWAYKNPVAKQFDKEAPYKPTEMYNNVTFDVNVIITVEIVQPNKLVQIIVLAEMYRAWIAAKNRKMVKNSQNIVVKKVASSRDKANRQIPYE